MTMDQCKKTCQALRDNENVDVPDACVDALLLWLCGGRNGPADIVYRTLGSPFDYPDQLWRVCLALDASLFRNSELIPLKGKRDALYTRYRLLSRAFHPDRYPDLSVWLSPRAQVINAAFDGFRKQKDQQPEAAQPGSSGASRTRPSVARTDTRYARQIGMHERFIRLTAPLAHARFLPQKILILTALLCALPLIYFYQERSQTAAYVQMWPDVSGFAAGVAPDIPAGFSAGEDLSAPAQAMAVVYEFRDSFEQGRLQALLKLIAEQPRQDGNSGSSWFRQSYESLFEQTIWRFLQVDIDNSSVDGDTVALSGRYAMRLIYADGEYVNRSGPVKYRLLKENGDLKISAIDYLE